MGNNPSNFEGDDLPVESVSWNNVQEFIKKLNEKEGTNKYRLPSEAGWEYAWYDENSDGRTHSVGEKKPNPWGLYDIHGNVYEWVQDIYHNSYSGAPTDGNVWEGDDSARGFRGGSWYVYAMDCRSANRFYGDPAYCDDSLGFLLINPSS